MKEKILSALLFLTVLVSPVMAQNNAFDLDDDCYKCYLKADQYLGKKEFDGYNAALLSCALEKGDNKAETLYYVEYLKNLTRVITARKKVDNTRGNISEEEETTVTQAAQNVLNVSRKYGYPQYFYYAYEILENFYYNQDQFLKVMELVEEMQKVARENKEDYGIWMGDRYMISLYVAQNDYISAKKYILKAIDMFNSTEDPTILRQSATRLYCDLADTYPIGHDSVLVNVSKAEATRKQHLDTLRCQYYRAKLNAFYKDKEGYEAARNYCLGDPYLFQISQTAEEMFANLDKIVFTPEGEDPQIDISGMDIRVREYKYIANVAENYNFKDLAFEMEKHLVSRNENLLSASNRSKLTELETRMGYDTLNAKVDEQASDLAKATRTLLLLITFILLGVLTFSWIYIANLKKANEKVRLANEAKTRFVQNMSHEVRTPLNAIVGFSQLLSLPDGSFPPEEKDEFAGHIINNTKMLTMLLDDILNVSAMDNGNYRITYEEGEVHFMCQAAISSAEHRLQPGVRMYYEPESDEPFTFRTDPRRVQQILINYLTNSCKHTTQGEIKLSSSLTENPGYVTFAVTDTGPGVPADKAEAIFERFTKLNDFVQGTGLGLSICRDIASRMGAKVFLDTTYTAGGARFVFLVPVTPPEQNPVNE